MASGREKRPPFLTYQGLIGLVTILIVVWLESLKG